MTPAERSKRIEEAARAVVEGAIRDGRPSNDLLRALDTAIRSPVDEPATPPAVECDPCACRRAVPGMWTSGYDSDPCTARERVRHGAVECVIYEPKSAPPAPSSGTTHRDDGQGQRFDECPRCDGRGYEDPSDTLDTCRDCNRTGRLSAESKESE